MLAFYGTKTSESFVCLRSQVGVLSTDFDAEFGLHINGNISTQK